MDLLLRQRLHERQLAEEALRHRQSRPHRITFDEDDWTFEATFNEPGVDFRRNGRRVAARVEKIDDHTHRVFPAGRAGTWHVDVSGRGESGGDVITTFAWTTTEAGEFPEVASGTAAVLADHDGVIDSYGVEMDISDLAATPQSASASITITNEVGRSSTIELGSPAQAWQEGTVSWRRGARQAAAGLVPAHPLK